MSLPLLDVQEAAKQLGIAPKTLYKWVETGRMPHIKIGRLVRLRPSDIDAWVNHHLTPKLVPAHAGGPVKRDKDSFLGSIRKRVFGFITWKGDGNGKAAR